MSSDIDNNSGKHAIVHKINKVSQTILFGTTMVYECYQNYHVYLENFIHIITPQKNELTSNI